MVSADLILDLKLVELISKWRTIFSKMLMEQGGKSSSVENGTVWNMEQGTIFRLRISSTNFKSSKSAQFRKSEKSPHLGQVTGFLSFLYYVPINFLQKRQRKNQLQLLRRPRRKLR